MKKIISIILCFVLMNSISFAQVNDIKSHWAYDEIVRNINNEYILGYPDNTFKPENYIKENELITILVKIMENSILPLKQEWDKPFIDYGVDIGLIEFENRSYDIYITRKKCFEIIYDFININLKDNKTIFNKQQIKTEGKIDVLLEIGVVNGYPDKSLKLEKYITRAETTKIINKAIDYIDNCIYEEKINIDFFNKEDIYNYTNYTSMKDTLFLNSFEIINSNVYYTDLGRYNTYSKIYIDKYNKTVIDILQKLINKNNFVSNTYFKDGNYITICYGEKKQYVYNNNALFEIVLYEKEQLLNNNYKYDIKINVYQLWKELNEIRQNIKVNKFYKSKLLNTLKIFLNEQNVNKINNYIIQNSEAKLYDDNLYIEKLNQCIYMYIDI